MTEAKLTLNRMQKEFEIYLFAQEKAKNTLTSYKTDTNQFVKFLNLNYSSKVYIDDIDLRILEDYKLHLNEKVKSKTLTSQTRDRKLDSLKKLYQFLEERHKKENLAKKLVFGRTKKDGYNPETGEVRNKIKFLTKEESKELLDKIKASNHIDKFRDYCIVLLMLSTGMRSCSVRNLKWEDVNFEKLTLLVKDSKNKTAYTVPISEELCQALSSYWMASHETLDFVFLSNKGNPISKTAFNNAIKRLLKHIEVEDPGLSSHIFRHTFVMRMLSNNVEPEKIIRFTGHSSVNEIKPYINFKIDDLRDCLPKIA